MHVIIKDCAGWMSIEGYVRPNGDAGCVLWHQEDANSGVFDRRIWIGTSSQPDVVRHISHGRIDFCAVYHPARFVPRGACAQRCQVGTCFWLTVAQTEGILSSQ